MRNPRVKLIESRIDTLSPTFNAEKIVSAKQDFLNIAVRVVEKDMVFDDKYSLGSLGIAPDEDSRFRLSAER